MLEKNRDTKDLATSFVLEQNKDKKRSAYVFTFGCQQNEADSEKIVGMLSEMGYEPTLDYRSADLIILNTCAVRHHAEDKALSMLGSFKAQKKKNPELIIGVAGCMAAERHIVGKLKEDFHYVDFTLEPSMLDRLPLVLKNLLTERKRSFLLGEGSQKIVEGIAVRRKAAYRGLVTVMYGCNNFCSYCIVPYTRGRERSRDSKEILCEVNSLVKDGVREIMLLGQNVNSYSADINFPTLLSRIAEIEGDFIIRFMTSHPKDAGDELIEVMAKYSPKIAPFFHLPLQSGSNKILSLMNRRYTREKYLTLAKKIKEKIPNIALSTDIIVGFPGEDEEDFLDTLDALSEIEYDQVYAFIYSRREGTRAAEFADTVSREVATERLTRLNLLQDEISKKKNLPYLDRVVRGLVECEEIRDGKRILTARTDTNKPVHFESDSARVGEFVNIKITKICATHLYGEERGNKND